MQQGHVKAKFGLFSRPVSIVRVRASSGSDSKARAAAKRGRPDRRASNAREVRGSTDVGPLLSLGSANPGGFFSGFDGAATKQEAQRRLVKADDLRDDLSVPISG
jgi:hypothetical protein